MPIRGKSNSGMPPLGVPLQSRNTRQKDNVSPSGTVLSIGDPEVFSELEQNED